MSDNCEIDDSDPSVAAEDKGKQPAEQKTPENNTSESITTKMGADGEQEKAEDSPDVSEQRKRNMRDFVEYQFYFLDFSKQSEFLEFLRIKAGDNSRNYYAWVKMGLAYVHFDTIPDKVIAGLFLFLINRGWLVHYHLSLYTDTMEVIREANSKRREVPQNMWEKKRRGEL
ncbi:hypothetical protein AJ79_09866 [Helicocarpus griseus UAMH5409]|uniref:Uncharacterized protein n=1 Tax=Helicocarpus griseus UAMH5409 TaxID=1447875 RepID=A0A2B7WGM3_9EURO|nr:hypothetical protein AJ79_09866 [Helicocarpus griseus UAMH5409]